MTLDKTVASADEALAGVTAGMSIAVGGFGKSGVPLGLIHALLRTRADGLEIISNNCGTDGWGLGLLLAEGRIRRVTASYVGENLELSRRWLAGEIEIELIPQGTLAERLRAGGAGIPAFYTPAGVGTWVQHGGIPWHYGADGTADVVSPARELRAFDGQDHVLERSVRADVALVHAYLGDRHGNLVYRKSARNFNPLCAMAGRLTIAEVEHLVEPGEIDPDHVHTPGVYVQRVVEVGGDQ